MTDTLRLLFYLVETERQAEIFNDALEDSVAAALVSGDSLRTWRHLQGALFAAIIVNRLVTNDGTQRGRSGWTSKQAKDAATWRVKELRRLLELPEADPRATPIYDVRGLRDSLEHIDERIDRAVHSAGVLSLSDWYLSDGRLITTPEESDAEGRQAGLRAFYPEGGLALFDRRSLDLFALDLDMMKLRHNAREAEAELAQSLKGRCRFGGGQLRNIQFLDGEPDRVAWWRRRRQEILSEFAPSARLDGYVRLWAEPGQPPNQ